MDRGKFPQKVWLDGKLAYDSQKDDKADKSLTKAVALALPAGASTLLVKIGKPAGSPAYHAVLQAADAKAKPEFTPALAELLAVPPEERSAEQRAALATERQESDPKVRSAREQLRRLAGRFEFATQRAVPGNDEFLRTFGQPKRESPCAASGPTSRRSIKPSRCSTAR